MRPTQHPTFALLPTPATLRVPVITRGSEPRSTKPIGTRVAAGERLVESVSPLDPWPLAPAAGEIIGTARVMLTNGRSTHAIELQTLSESADDANQSIHAASERSREDAGHSSVEEPASSRLRSEAACDVPLKLQSTAPADGDRGGWIDRLRDAGVWADRWTSPNLFAQLHDSLRRPIDTVVCSLLDGDPNLPIGAAIASQMVDRLIAGVRLMTQISGATQSIIVMQQRLLPDVAAAIKKEPTITALEIVNDYPQADPSILLAGLLKRKLRPGRLPSDQGVLLFDAVAAVMAGRVVIDQAPMLHLPVALFNHSRNTTHLAKMPVGSSLNDLLDAQNVSTGGFVFRCGDVLRDRRVTREAVIAGGEIVLHASPGPTSVNPDPCIRCGWCVEACPSRIHPAGLLDAAQRRDEAAADYFGIAACVECGLCDYVCPSRLPILQGIRTMRGGALKAE